MAKPRSKGPSRQRQVAIFCGLGVDDPETFAADGPHSVARWLFLTGLWRSIVPEGHDDWQKRWAKADPVGDAIGRLAAGASPADLTLVVRQLQILALYNAVQLLDHPAHGIEDLQSTIAENVEWRIASYDGEAEALGSPLGELHGAFLRLDPAGRMGEPPVVAKPRRPRSATPKKHVGAKRRRAR